MGTGTDRKRFIADLIGYLETTEVRTITTEIAKIIDCRVLEEYESNIIFNQWVNCTPEYAAGIRTDYWSSDAMYTGI